MAFIVAADAPAPQKVIDQQQHTLRDFLLRPPADYRPVARRLPRTVKQFQVPTAVTFSDNAQLGHTDMEVVSQDRPGLLYWVSKALVDCRIKLKSAKISTVGEKAEDTFQITDRDHNPVADPARRQRLAALITQHLGPHDH